MWEVQLSHTKLLHSTGTGITRMQLAKVVIASALVLATCAKGLPEGIYSSTAISGITCGLNL